MDCIKGIGIGLLSLLLGASVNAGVNSNFDNELLRDCTHPSPGTFIAGVCLGYLKGAAEMSRLKEKLPKLPPVCIPDALTVGQLRNIVVHYLEEHPEELHYASIVVLKNALDDAFPCEALPAPQ
jgi:hypothetical protein